MRPLQALALVVASVLGAVGVGALGLLAGLEHLLLDVRLRARPAPDPSASVRVVVVTDDDLTAQGGWPMDRSAFGALARVLREGGVTALGLDFEFDSVGRTQEGDALLGQEAREAGAVVVGASFQLEGPRGARPTDPALIERFSIPAPAGARFPQASRLTLPVAAIARQAPAVAFLNAPTDGDGKTRRAYLLLEYQGRLFPSLPLAVYLAHVGRRLSDVRIGEDGAVELPTADGGRATVPLDDQGRLLLDPPLQEDFPVHALGDLADVFDGAADPALAASYRGRPVLCGFVAAGTTDVVATAREPSVHGVFVQAGALMQLLERRFVTSAGAASVGALSALLALLGVGLVLLVRGPWQVLPPLLVLGLPLLASVVAARSLNWVPPLTVPLLAGLAATASAATLRALNDARRRRRVESAFQGFLPRPILSQLLADPTQAWSRPQRCAGALLAARILRHDVARLAPEEDAGLLTALFEAAVDVLVAQGGTVVRLDPDRVVAVFGAPVAHPGPGPAALAAAFRLRAAWKAIGSTWIDRLGTPFDTAFALHAGVLTVGPVGSTQHREFTVFGPEVGAVLALLARAGPDQILGSDRIQSLVSTQAESVVVDQSEDGRSIFELTPGAPP